MKLVDVLNESKDPKIKCDHCGWSWKKKDGGKGKKNKIEISKQSSTIKALQKLFGFCSEAPTDDGSTNASANDLLKKQLKNNKTIRYVIV